MAVADLDCHRYRRRFHCVAWTVAEGHRCCVAVLGVPTQRTIDFFCYLLLPRQRGRFSKSRFAADSGACFASFPKTLASSTRNLVHSDFASTRRDFHKHLTSCATSRYTNIVGDRSWSGTAYLWHATTTNLVAVTFAIIGAALIFFAVAQAKSTYNMAERWRRTLAEISNEGRWDAVRVATQAVPDAGWFGFGPGTFSVIFPYYERVQKAKDPGGWSFLHEDYLQTLLEWGWAGVAGWAVIFLGGIATGIRVLTRLRKRKLKPAPRFYRILPLVLIALSMIALHSIVDFPLQIASLQLYAATYLGICWGSRKVLAEN